MESLFQRADDRDFLADESPGAELSLEGKGFEGIRNMAWTGGTEMEDNEAGAHGGGGFQGGEGVAFRKAAGCGAGIGKFIGIRVGAEEFNGNGAKIVEDIDPGGLRRLVFCEDPGPKIEAGVVAEFHRGEAKIGGLSEEGGAIGRAVGVPAGRKGKGGSGHAGSVSRKKKKRAKGFFETEPRPGFRRRGEGVEESLSCGQYAIDDGETDLLQGESPRGGFSIQRPANCRGVYGGRIGNEPAGRQGRGFTSGKPGRGRGDGEGDRGKSFGRIHTGGVE